MHLTKPLIPWTGNAHDERQIDSDEEREAAEFRAGLKQKLISQATKKSMKNNARMPRTAGLKTLSELSTSMKKAGLDPSKIEQRAALIAKARGMKRKRNGDEEMDVDEEEGGGEDGYYQGEGEEGGDWMDVDEDGEGDDGRSPPKRRKSNTGTAVTSTGKHAPRTNRQTAGMRDQTQVSKAVRLRNLGQRERNMHAKAGESDRAIKVKMVSFRDHTKREGPHRLLITTVCSRSTCFPANGKEERLKDGEGFRTLSLCLYPLQNFSSPTYPCRCLFCILRSVYKRATRWAPSHTFTSPSHETSTYRFCVRGVHITGSSMCR